MKKKRIFVGLVCFMSKISTPSTPSNQFRNADTEMQAHGRPQFLKEIEKFIQGSDQSLTHKCILKGLGSLPVQ